MEHRYDTGLRILHLDRRFSGHTRMFPFFLLSATCLLATAAYLYVRAPQKTHSRSSLVRALVDPRSQAGTTGGGPGAAE